MEAVLFYPIRFAYLTRYEFRKTKLCKIRRNDEKTNQFICVLPFAIISDSNSSASFPNISLYFLWYILSFNHYFWDLILFPESMCRLLVTFIWRTMAVSVKMMSLIVGTFGVISFIFGVVAENKKVSICNLLKQASCLTNCSIFTADICSFEIVNSENEDINWIVVE